MALVTGTNVVFGVASEEVRNTPETTINSWVGAITPLIMTPDRENTVLRETTGSRSASTDTLTNGILYSGETEFYVRNANVGYFLHSLLGQSVTGAPDVNNEFLTHSISVGTSPQTPTLTIASSFQSADANVPDYTYGGGVVSSMDFNISTDNVVTATANILALSENEETNNTYTPDFTLLRETEFPRYESRVFIGNDGETLTTDFTTVAGLNNGTASGICVRGMSFSINNNAQAKNCISKVTPDDMYAGTVEITGQLEIDFDSKTYHDLVVENQKRSIYLDIRSTHEGNLRYSINPANGANTPVSMKFFFPRVTFDTFDLEAPLDDILTQTVSFTAHAHPSSGQILVQLANNKLTPYQN